jgi:hypothetical protein
MISNYVLANWKRHLGATGLHLPKPPAPALGAYDARGGLRGGRDDDPRNLADFGRGGKYDTGGDSPLEALRKVAARLSPEDWSELRDVLTEEGEGEDDASTIETMMPRRIEGRDNEGLEPRGGYNNNDMPPRGRRQFGRQDLGQDRRRTAMDARVQRYYRDEFDHMFPNVARIGIV